jgi:hypothetical protein
MQDSAQANSLKSFFIFFLPGGPKCCFVGSVLGGTAGRRNLGCGGLHIFEVHPPGKCIRSFSVEALRRVTRPIDGGFVALDFSFRGCILAGKVGFCLARLRP